MVEFVRDVIIAVAVLATLIAVAVHPGPEAEPLGHGSGMGPVVGARLPVVLNPGPAPGDSAQPK